MAIEVAKVTPAEEAFAGTKPVEERHRLDEVKLAGGNMGMVDTIQPMTCHDFFKVGNVM